MEVVDGGKTCGVSPMVTSLGESRDSERQDHSGVCQVTGVTGGVFAQNEQGSTCVVDIPSECGVPGTETSTMSMVNKSLMQSENVQCKVISNAKAIGRSCYKVGDEGQILKVKVAGQCVSLLVDTGSQVSVLMPQVYEALPEKHKSIIETEVSLNAVNGTPFPVKGTVKVPLEISEEKDSSDEAFLVADI